MARSILGMMGILVVLLFPVVAGAQTTIELRAAAAVAGDKPLRLGDIATVSGEDAEALAGAVISADPEQLAGAGRALEIGVEDVRKALSEAKVRWGRTALRGSKCSVVLTGGTGVKKDEARAAPAQPSEVSVEGPATVKTEVVRALGRLYNVGAGDMRLLFEDKDADLLGTATAGRRVDVQPTNSGATSQVGLRVYVFSGDRLLTQRTITVQALVRRTVVTALAQIQRRDTIEADDFTTGQQWLAPSAAVAAAPEQVVGAVAKGRINAGQVITQAHIEAPIVVKRGDIVEVHCLAGGVHLKASRARALGTGRDGELVEFQLEGSKRTFHARMSGKGTAVLSLDPDPTITESRRDGAPLSKDTGP